MKHTTSGEAKHRSGTTWLIYGVAGTGKTPLASLFPHPWFWDFEAGTASMIKDDILVSSPESYAEVVGLVQAAVSSPPGKVTLAGKQYSYCSIIVDTTGELARVFEGTKMGTEKPRANFGEWYLIVERFRNVTRELRNLRDKGINVVFLAHEQYLKQAEIEVIAGLPDLPGKELPTDLPKLCDIVGHLRYQQTATGTVRQLVCEPSGVFIGRDRRGILKTHVIDLHDKAGTEKFIVEQGGANHICQGG